MKIMDIFFKNLRQLSRDRKNMFFLILFPAIFMLIFGTAFGGLSIEDTTFNLGVINHDEGNYSNDLIKTVSNLELDNSTKVFNIVNLSSEREGNSKLESGAISSMLVIPKEYSYNFEHMGSRENISDVEIIGDPSSTEYSLSETILTNVFLEYSSNIQEQSSGFSFKTINLIPSSIEGTSDFNTFDYIAPGLIIFAILMTVTSVSANISKETENGMLKRLRLSRMRSSDYVIGNLLSWSLVGAIQVVILLLVATCLGFHWQGGLVSILIAILIGILATISSVALSLIIVSLTKSSDQASNLSAIIAVPLSFLCGSFFPLPDFILGTFGGHEVQIYEILPWNQAITAFREVLIFGGGFGDILINLFLILIMGLILLSISILLFRRKLSSSLTS